MSSKVTNGIQVEMPTLTTNLQQVLGPDTDREVILFPPYTANFSNDSYVIQIVFGPPGPNNLGFTLPRNTEVFRLSRDDIGILITQEMRMRVQGATALATYNPLLFIGRR